VAPNDPVVGKSRPKIPFNERHGDRSKLVHNLSSAISEARQEPRVALCAHGL
jgi:hypothetical protein